MKNFATSLSSVLAKTGSIVLLLLLSPTTSLGQAEGAETLPVRFLTYNVHHCVGTDNVLNLPRIKDVIQSRQPDIVAIQELDSFTSRTGRSYQLGNLARLLDMKATFGPTIPYQGGKYGIGLLSREVPLSVRQIPLPGEEPRLLLVCEFEHFVFACTHLDLKEEQRLASVPIINAEAEKWNKPFLIAGDLNDIPSSKSILKLRQTFIMLNAVVGEKSYTFPSENPSRCGDYIACYKKQLHVESREVIDEPVASDHRPVFVIADIPYLTDGIRNNVKDVVETGPIFSIDGRLQQTYDWSHLSKGIYIRGDKKVLVK